MYKRYGAYINQSRAFPLSIDGLKPVERRVLLSAYEIAKDKFVKCARVDGHTIGHFHPHGTCYSTIVQLVHQGFIDGSGNFGTNMGVEPAPAAAMRYTECKLSKKMIDLAFRLINYVPWSISELQDPNILEPEFPPVMYPLCLLGKEYTTGIGFGFKTQIPCYSADDLHKRLLYLLGKEKEKPIIKPISDCDIISSNDDLELLLTTGKATISFVGKYKVIPSSSKVVIQSIPQGKKFEKSILSKLSKELESQDIGWIDESSQENGGTYIVFEVLKSRNRDAIFKKMVSLIDDALKGSVSFEMIVVDSNTKKVKLISVDEMLLSTYEMYKKTNELFLKNEIEKSNKVINDNNLILKIRPFISKYLKNKIDDIDSVISFISKDSKIEESVIKELISKNSIRKLLSVDIDNKDLENKIFLLNKHLDKIDSFVLKQYADGVK